MSRVITLRRVRRLASRTSVAVAALESTVAAGLAHLAAGGSVPSAGWLLTLLAMGYVAGCLVLRHRRPMRMVVPALIGAQVVAHAWLVAMAPSAHQHSAGDPGAGAVGLLGLSWSMLLAHVVAGAVAAITWAMRRRAVDVLTGWVDTGRLPSPRLRPAPVSLGPAVCLVLRVISTSPTRGPPAWVPAAA